MGRKPEDETIFVYFPLIPFITRQHRWKLWLDASIFQWNSNKQ